MGTTGSLGSLGSLDSLDSLGSLDSLDSLDSLGSLDSIGMSWAPTLAAAGQWMMCSYPCCSENAFPQPEQMNASSMYWMY